MRSALARVFVMLLAAGSAYAAEFRPAGHEVWSGTYTCGAMEGDPERPGYSSRARLVLENGVANVTRESERVRETLTGDVAPDGSVQLEGTGSSKEGGTRWRFRFDGRFEGERFSAKGAMLSNSSSKKLRDCSMTLTRVQASGAPAPVSRESPVAAAPPKPQPAPPVVAAKADKPAAARAVETPAPATKPPALIPMKVVEGKELNFSKGNDTAVVHAKLSRTTPHRYPLVAKKGQTLSVTLRSDGGAQLDVYEPGASLDTQAGGFVVQGTRLKSAVEGAVVKAELPSDGKYLVLVRALRDEAHYTLEMAATPAPASVEPESTWSLGAWMGDKTMWMLGLLALAVAGAGIVMYSKRDRRLFRTR